MYDQSLSPEELSALVAKAQDGNTEAFGKIYDAFLTPVYRYILFRFPEDLVEDLVADVFVKAWEKLDTYKVRSGIPFSAWLFRIARHTLIDAYRSQRGFEELSEELMDPDQQNDPERRLEQQLSVSLVRQAITELPKDMHDIILLHYIAGLGHAEVAETLGIGEGNVRTLKFRALQKLEEIIQRLTKNFSRRAS